MDANSVRIVILEPTKFAKDGIKEFYSEIFGKLGYEASFTEITASSKDFEGNKSVFRNEVVDLFVTDLSLGEFDSGDYGGLDIIAAIKRKYPDVLVIANSSRNVTYLDTSGRVPSFDLFVQKQRRNDEKYKKYITERVSDLFKRNIYLQVDYENSIIDDKYKESTKRVELENLLRIITFSCIGVTKRTCVARVRLEKIEGGMSKSEVYRLYGYTYNDLPCVNVVLKISLRGHAEIEYKNYLQYVKWYLPYTFRPELLSHAYWNEIGCICYSYAFNDNEGFNSLTYFIRKGELERVNNVIEQIFNPKYKTWYHGTNVKEEKDITKYYHAKWLNRSSPDNNIRQIILQSGINDTFFNDNQFRINGKRFIMPGPYLTGHPRGGTFLTCICHGDLSSNNILLSDSGIVTFIDFQDSGIGHIFDDFIVLELSLRMYFRSENNFVNLLDEELELIKYTLLSEGDSSINSSFSISDSVRRIRKRAFENFFPESKYNHKQQTINYLYGLAVSSYGMLRKEHFQMWQKQQLLALTLAATTELYKLEN
jgi:hypothetical protein